MDAKPSITLANGETRPLRLTTGTLYRFEKNGGRLARAQELPVQTMVDLAIAAIRKPGETDDDLLDQLPDFGTLAKTVTAALEASGLGETAAAE